MTIMNRHLSGFGVDRDIALVEVVIREKFFDQVTLLPKQHYELVKPVI
jgi:hypothetical protein